jgi:hypothetical protein
MVLGSIVDTDALLQTVAAAIATGVGVTIVFSFAIYGAARFTEARRDARPLAAGISALFTMVALAAFGAAIAFGIVVMISK